MQYFYPKVALTFIAGFMGGTAFLMQSSNQPAPSPLPTVYADVAQPAMVPARDPRLDDAPPQSGDTALPQEDTYVPAVADPGGLQAPIETVVSSVVPVPIIIDRARTVIEAPRVEVRTRIDEPRRVIVREAPRYVVRAAPMRFAAPRAVAGGRARR